MDQRNMAPRHAKRRREKEMRKRRMITMVVVIAFLCVVIAVVCKACSGKTEETKDVDTKVTTEATTVDPDMEVSSATVLSTGDVLIHKMLLDASASGDGYSFTKHFRAVKEMVSAADYAVANLEVSLAESNYTCYPTFKSPDSTVDALKDAGFDCLVCANNHCYDGGFSGLKRTASVVQEKGLDQTGTKATLDDPDYIIADVNGIKIGILNYAEETTTSSAKKALNGINLSDEACDYVNSFISSNLTGFYSEVETLIADMKENGAEAIMLYIHWGVEYSLTPSTQQKTIAQKMCDLGVDVIIGGHPHVIQPATTLTSADGSHKTFCIYSVGNLLSNQRTAYMGSACTTGHTEDGIFVYTTFTKYGDGRVELTDVSYVPLWVNRYSEDGSYVYEITPLDDLSKVTQNKESAEKSKARTVALVDEGFKAFS